MTISSDTKEKLQLVWGIALLAVGVGVFIRIPQVMPELAKIEQFKSVLGFIRICFYIMGIILVGGGIKKIVYYGRTRQSASKASGSEKVNNGSGR